MAISTLTIPAQLYPVGVTRGQVALAGGQTYSHADVTVDFTGWVSPLTTRIDILVEVSVDGGLTWRHVVGFPQVSPPPYQSRAGGTTNTTTIHWDIPAPYVPPPTHLRGSVTVAGLVVPLGAMTLRAS
jgi:hypothetical protein